MAVRNQHWYNRNEANHYPLDDSASGVTDDGLILPTNIICDLHLRFPDSLGQTVFINAVAVTDHLVTVTLMAASEFVQGTSCPTASSASVTIGTVPIATVTLRKPLDRYRHYALDPQSEGVGGWIVFGAGVNDTRFNGRFSTPQQSALGPKSAKRYKEFPIRSLGKLHSSIALEGVVRLIAGNDIEITTDVPAQAPLLALQQLYGVPLSAVYIRLKDQADIDVFDLYAGPCKGRPESGTCEGLQPIEFINSVGPDCDGNLTIEFEGCSVPGKILVGEPCGAILDCDLGLSDVCSEADRLPDDEGNLPQDVDSDCP